MFSKYLGRIHKYAKIKKRKKYVNMRSNLKYVPEDGTAFPPSLPLMLTPKYQPPQRISPLSS